MRTAIYCRVSSPGQKDNTSTPEQERLCREKAAQLGWEVSEAHVYHEVEGGDDMYRPQMDRLWLAVIRHEIDAVVIKKYDRLSRELAGRAVFRHHADRYGVQLVAVDGEQDDSEEGRILSTVSDIVARMEHVAIRERTQSGRRAHVASGKMLAGGHPLYGYQWGDPEKGKRTYYVKDPETWPIVERIFKMVAAGVSAHQIVREFEAEGVPTAFQVLQARGQLPKGRTVSARWQHTRIHTIINTPAYWGEHSAYRHKTTREKIRPADTGITRKVRRTTERAVDDPDRVALPNACPVIVSKELAERAQAQLARNKKDNPTRNPDPLATIWRKMVFCGHCGYRMFTAPAAHGDGRKYCCRSHPAVNGLPVECPGGKHTMNASMLDVIGWADVRAWLRDEDNVRRLLAEWEQEEKNAENSAATRLEASAATIMKLRETMNHLADGIAELSTPEARQPLREKMELCADQLRKEEAKRERLMGEASAVVDHAKDAREIREWVSAVASHADSFTRLEQVTVLRALDAQVTIWRKDHIHDDGWPQRYKIVLHFTGFTGQPVTLPPANSESDKLLV